MFHFFIYVHDVNASQDGTETRNTDELCNEIQHKYRAYR